MTTIAFIGFGEAGGLLAQGLKGAGATVTACYDILIDDPKTAGKIEARAAERGIEAARSPAEAVAGADVVLSAVVCSETVVAAKSAAPHLKPGQIYMDINSSSPGMKREAAAAIEASGAAFVEAAVMDLVPPHGHKVPMLFAGAKAKELETLLTPYGMRLEAIGDRIGAASAIKMIRSVFLKGFTSVLFECLLAAHRAGVADRVLDSVQGTFPEMDWRKLADYYAPRKVLHAKRQAAEMREVAETLAELGVTPRTTLASAEIMEWIVTLGLTERPGGIPKTYAEVMDAVGAAEAAPVKRRAG
jgi:3-hydroxyisobutyrate dehydrogenase-like beta-hydroxyacid dehydrogenase